MLFKRHFFFIIIILLAWLLRLHNLIYHSLWFDEAVSVHWAKQSIPRILEVGFNLTEDRLPPLYYLMLKGWSALFGLSETAIRMLSVLFGVLLVPVVAKIALLLFNRRVALITAALVALNPFLIWYAQEARMYAPAVFFASLTVLSFLCWLQISTGYALRFTFYVLLFTLSAAAGLYSHLYTGFLLPALGLWLMVSYPRAWRAWLTLAVSGLIVMALFAPIGLATWHFSAEASPGNPWVGLPQRAWWLLQAFTIWKAPLPAAWQIAIPTLTGLLALLAFVHFPSQRETKVTFYASRFTWYPSPLLLITLLLLVPFIVANLLLLRNHLAFFGERYFIIMVPWLLLLAAVGANKLAEWRISERRTGGAQHNPLFIIHHASRSFIIHHSPLIILLLAALPIPGQWSVPASKEAWRQSAAYLAQHAAADHAILIHPDWVRFPFQYYFQGPGQTYAAFSTVTPETALDGPLQGVVNDHPVIWLIQSHLDAPDPERRVEQWLAARYPLVTEIYPPGIALKGYAPGYQLAALPAEASPVNLQFQNGLSLIGYQAEAEVSATDPLFHPPSGWLHVTLYWTASQAVSDQARPFVHLVGPEGIWGISLDRPGDALDFYPPAHWPARDDGAYPIIRHDLDVNLNPATPPGVYQLVVGMQGDEQQYLLRQVEVRPLGD